MFPVGFIVLLDFWRRLLCKPAPDGKHVASWWLWGVLDASLWSLGTLAMVIYTATRGVESGLARELSLAIGITAVVMWMAAAADRSFTMKRGYRIVAIVLSIIVFVSGICALPALMAMEQDPQLERETNARSNIASPLEEQLAKYIEVERVDLPAETITNPVTFVSGSATGIRLARSMQENGLRPEIGFWKENGSVDPESTHKGCVILTTCAWYSTAIEISQRYNCGRVAILPLNHPLNFPSTAAACEFTGDVPLIPADLSTSVANYILIQPENDEDIGTYLAEFRQYMQEITTDNVPVRFLVPVASPAVIVAWRRSFASYYVPMIVGDLATGDQMTVFAKAAYSKIPYQQNLGGEKSPGVAMVMGPVVCKESSDALLPMGVQAGLVLLLCIVSIIDGLDGNATMAAILGWNIKKDKSLFAAQCASESEHV